MDANAVAGMIFTLLLALIIGGFILLLPLTRRLGLLLEQRLANRSGTSESDAAQVAELRRGLEDMRVELERLAQRQDYMEGMLAAPKPEDREKLTP